MATTLTEAIIGKTRIAGTDYTLDAPAGAVAALIYTYEGTMIDQATEIHYYGDMEYAEVSLDEDRAGARMNRRTVKRLVARNAEVDEYYQEIGDDEWMVSVRLVRL